MEEWTNLELTRSWLFDLRSRRYLSRQPNREEVQQYQLQLSSDNRAEQDLISPRSNREHQRGQTLAREHTDGRPCCTVPRRSYKDRPEIKVN
jgi:hypothetical protein